MNLDLADVKPSLLNWAIIGLMAVTFILVAKWIMVKWPIPGLSDVINAV